MIIKALPSGPYQTNAYLIGCPATLKAVIIDPGVESCHEINAFIEKNSFTPEAIWLTHTHWDHTASVATLKEKYKIPAAVHPAERLNLEVPGSDGLPMMMHIEPASAELLLQEGDVLNVGDIVFTVIHTPGHSPGGVCFYSEKEKTLISGDTLFKESIGNLSFPGCNAEAMWSSLKKLEQLPEDTNVYPGHGPSTKIGNEMHWLPNARIHFG